MFDARGGTVNGLALAVVFFQLLYTSKLCLNVPPDVGLQPRQGRRNGANRQAGKPAARDAFGGLQPRRGCNQPRHILLGVILRILRLIGLDEMLRYESWSRCLERQCRRR